MKNCLVFLLALACAPFVHATKPTSAPTKTLPAQQHAIAQEITNLFTQQPLYAAWKNRTAPFTDDQAAIALGKLITFKQLCLEDKRLKKWASTGFLRDLPLPEDAAPALYDCVKKLCKKVCVAPPLIFIRRPTMLPAGHADLNSVDNVHILALSYELLMEESLPAIEAVIARQIIHLKENTAQKRHDVLISSALTLGVLGAMIGFWVGLTTLDRFYDIDTFLTITLGTLLLESSTIIGALTPYYLLKELILPLWHRSQEKNADLKALRLLKSPAHYRAFMRLLKKWDAQRFSALTQKDTQEMAPCIERYNQCKQYIEREIMPLDTQAASREQQRLEVEHAQQKNMITQKIAMTVANHLMREILVPNSPFPALKDRLAYLNAQYKRYKRAQLSKFSA